MTKAPVGFLFKDKQFSEALFYPLRNHTWVFDDLTSAWVAHRLESCGGQSKLPETVGDNFRGCQRCLTLEDVQTVRAVVRCAYELQHEQKVYEHVNETAKSLTHGWDFNQNINEFVVTTHPKFKMFGKNELEERLEYLNTSGTRRWFNKLRNAYDAYWLKYHAFDAPTIGTEKVYVSVLLGATRHQYAWSFNEMYHAIGGDIRKCSVYLHQHIDVSETEKYNLYVLETPEVKEADDDYGYGRNNGTINVLDENFPMDVFHDAKSLSAAANLWDSRSEVDFVDILRSTHVALQ